MQGLSFRFFFFKDQRRLKLQNRENNELATHRILPQFALFLKHLEFSEVENEKKIVKQPTQKPNNVGN